MSDRRLAQRGAQEMQEGGESDFTCWKKVLSKKN